MLDGINTVINEMATTSEFKDGWDKLEVTVGPQQIVSLTWPAWKLKICSFKIPANEHVDVTQIETLDPLYDLNDTFAWKTFKNQSQHNWDTLEKAKVVDLVDAFLEGAWTPPWKCGHCMSRHSGKYTPRF